MRVYSVNDQLSKNSSICKILLERRLVSICSCEKFVFFVDVRGIFFIYEFVIQDAKGAPNLVYIGGFPISNTIMDSSLISSMAVTRQPQSRESGDSFFNLFVVAGGNFFKFYFCIPAGQSALIVEHQFISNHVYYFLLHKNNVVAFKGKSVEIFMLPFEQKIIVPELTFHNDSFITSNLWHLIYTVLHIWLLGLSFDYGIFTTLNQAISFESVTEKLSYEVDIHAESLTCKLLKYYISRDDLEMAKTVSLKIFYKEAALEMFLYQCMQDFISSKNGI